MEDRPIIIDIDKRYSKCCGFVATGEPGKEECGNCHKLCKTRGYDTYGDQLEEIVGLLKAILAKISET